MADNIYRIDTDLPTSTKIRKINDMVLELEGLVSSGKFDINEIDQLFDVVGTMRKYKRNIGLGNTTTTYTNWSHVKAESGYSIWKITPTNYQHNSVNKVYMNDKVFENRGEATSETATSFDKVFLYNGDSGSGYIDNTTEAGTETGTDFAVVNTINDYLYMGLGSTFGGIKFEWHTRGSNYTLKLEYWNGSVWTALAATTNSLEDGTSNFEGDGHITWTIPSSWALTSVNSSSKYWIRISSTTNPITVARAYFIIPKLSVPGLLALSTDEILKEEWAWCSFAGTVYVTIKNDGAASYEGNLFIKSASTSTNLQNFFVYNNPFTIDYEDKTFKAVTSINSNSSLTSNDGVVFVDASTSSIDIDLPTATGRSGMRFIIKVVDIGSGQFVSVSAPSGETINGAPTYTFNSDFDCIEIISNGSRWFIISNSNIAGAAAGANTALSNLVSVAINTSLISDTDSTDDLGSTSKAWANLYVDTIKSITGNALALTPIAGQSLTVNLSTTGDLIINTDQFYVDTSLGNVGIGVTSPTAILHLKAGTKNTNTTPLKNNFFFLFI